jgi:ketosteroid isomerase-like protein
MNLRTRKICQVLAMVGTMFVGPTALASDADDLTAMLHEFLAGASVGDVSAHDTFWSDDLIYTSSNGTRTDKATIIEGMSQAADAEDSGPSVIYTAEDVQVDLYGTTAVVAFKLVGTPQSDGGAAVAYYFNTGTFLKRDGAWNVVAWQATKIPEAEE